MPHGAGHEFREKAGDQEAEHEVDPEHLPVHREMLGHDNGELRVADLLPPGGAVGRHVVVHSGFYERGARPGFLDERPRVGQFHEQAHDQNQNESADPLRDGELPRHQEPQDDAQLDDEIRRRKEKRKRWDERRALSEHRAGHRGRGVGARRAGGSEHRRKGDFFRTIAAEKCTNALIRDERLDRARERKAEHQAPADVPEHSGRDEQRFPNPGGKRAHAISPRRPRISAISATAAVAPPPRT